MSLDLSSQSFPPPFLIYLPRPYQLLPHDLLLLHTIAFGEMLHSWKLFSKYAELTKAVKSYAGTQLDYPESEGLGAFYSLGE